MAAYAAIKKDVNSIECSALVCKLLPDLLHSLTMRQDWSAERIIGVRFSRPNQWLSATAVAIGLSLPELTAIASILGCRSTR